ncbi:DNA mismatch endonuclease Vsr [Rhizobium leguminosarum]|uniref:very short patch repair endonuclease n=1 Tax=Rhizobium leguminosarum TaxID=384 RepID=UPI001C9193C5|nr:very short patch repair endonuclease [Rhizobium leguminosarum]MBY3030979.1 DNA mismatch endonuclease Vsr [Rhizobium leguminosarum]
MADIVTPEVRSRMMSGIRSKNTKPELQIRRGLHAAGFRFRLHPKKLAGTPDLVLPKWRAVIFVHGCFWHGHHCHLFRWPSTRSGFWEAKITRNQQNDVKHLDELEVAGWRIAVVWECALRGRMKMPIEQAIEALGSWLVSGSPSIELGTPPNETAYRIFEDHP